MWLYLPATAAYDLTKKKKLSQNAVPIAVTAFRATSYVRLDVLTVLERQGITQLDPLAAQESYGSRTMRIVSVSCFFFAIHFAELCFSSI